MDVALAPEFISYAIGALCLMGAFHYGTQFYPPGWEYELEKRNNRRAAVLMCVGIAAIVVPLLL